MSKSTSTRWRGEVSQTGGEWIATTNEVLFPLGFQPLPPCYIKVGELQYNLINKQIAPPLLEGRCREATEGSRNKTKMNE